MIDDKFVEDCVSECFTLTDLQRKQIAESLVEWLKTRVGNVPELALQQARAGIDIQRLSRNLSLRYRNGKMEAVATGDSRSFLSALRRGTKWFDGDPGIENVIMGAIL